jgi:hypothetical protein
VSRQGMPFVLPPGGRPLWPTPPRYVIKWHRVDDWAQQALEPMDLYHYRDRREPRISGWRGQVVVNLKDGDEAYERGIPLENSPLFLGAPTAQTGGYRRVAIRVHTWERSNVSDMFQTLQDPRWITTGWAFSANAAAAKHVRYLQTYTGLLAKGWESRKLIATAFEIIWFTGGPDTDYV